ncbi:hypothetical protein OAU26_01425 [Mariniblastus sp.]|nr:hypothetical protein [Mariniblastus sp.]
MSDDELGRFLELVRTNCRFDELSDEWKAWSIGQIESAEGVNDWTTRNQQAQLYLCRLMTVFEHCINGGMLEKELLPTFISGASVCGLNLSRDFQVIFRGALNECLQRGLVICMDDDWWEPGMSSGSGRVRLYNLTPAGRRFSEMGVEERKPRRSAEPPKNILDQSELANYDSATPLQAATDVDPAENEAIEAIAKLPKSKKLAYLAAEYANSKLNKQLTDGEAWEYLHENGIEGCDELNDYKLPKKTSFANYMNVARREMGKQKYSPRGGRTGRSVAKSSDL